MTAGPSLRVLIADDEAKIVRLVASYLEAAGFETLPASDGREALALFGTESPDCLILDVNMPGLDGLEVARSIRRVSDAPIIFLSAKAEETDRIVGLEIGADDYVVKPFSPRELVSRVRAVLRRSARGGTGGRVPTPADRGGAPESPPRNSGQAGERLLGRGIELDFDKRRVLVDGEVKTLTAVQFDILALLMREPGRVFSRLQILEGSTGSSFEGYERTIDAHVKNIRKALGDESDSPRFIGTVRGVGYKFIE